LGPILFFHVIYFLLFTPFSSFVEHILHRTAILVHAVSVFTFLGTYQQHTRRCIENEELM